MAPDMRDVYAETLIELAEKDRRIVVMEADLMKATGTGAFKERFPDRLINVGVAEANMVSIAAGLSATGKIPFAASFGCFASRRVFDQFFISANYARLNVKLVGTEPGITATYNGGTHMTFEDIGIMRTVPQLAVFEPCDAVSLRKLLLRCAAFPGCTYMRLHRKGSQTLYRENEDFELGKGKVLRDGHDITLVASGLVMVKEALSAADELDKRNVSAAVIDMHTVKPLDEDLLISHARKTRAVVTCENHQIIGGLGSAVAEVLSETLPTPMARIGVNDEFGEVGDFAYLRERFGLTAANIVRRSFELLETKHAMEETV